jgi:hypothetical protein
MAKRYTRKELGAELRKRGFPISDSTINKLSAPSVGRGPPVDGWFGPFALYNLEDGVAWAEARLRPERSSLQPLSSKQDTAAKTGRAVMEAASPPTPADQHDISQSVAAE